MKTIREEVGLIEDDDEVKVRGGETSTQKVHLEWLEIGSGVSDEDGKEINDEDRDSIPILLLIPGLDGSSERDPFVKRMSRLANKV